MFQACVSISACIFYVSYEYIYTGYVCINGHTAGKKKKNTPTFLPYFSVACYANTTVFKFYQSFFSSVVKVLCNRLL